VLESNGGDRKFVNNIVGNSKVSPEEGSNSCAGGPHMKAKTEVVTQQWPEDGRATKRAARRLEHVTPSF